MHEKIASFYPFSAILEAMPDALVIVDEKGRIVSINQQTEKLFGYKRAELLGKLIEQLIPERFQKKHIQDRAYFLSHLCTRPMGSGLALFGLKKNGAEFSVDISLSPLKTDDGLFILAAVRDATRYMEIEKALRTKNSELELSNQKNITISNQQIKKEIFEREEAEKMAFDLQSQLIFAARQAGMAEIATSIVHNVGNLLNSVNVASSVLRKKIKESELLKFRDSLQKLLQQHSNDFDKFISQDPAGKNFSQYLQLLTETITDEHFSLMNEINDLEKNIAHIINIVFAQRVLASPMDVFTKTNIAEVIDDSLKIFLKPQDSKTINIIRHFNPIKPVIIDKTKLLQIVTNIVKNDIESLLLSTSADKTMTITLQEKDPLNFMIEFEDTGIGISPDNISKMFTYGFTTKKSGHGFGLYFSSCFATEMGGSLSIDSKGVGKGAKFTLILPYQPPE